MKLRSRRFTFGYLLLAAAAAIRTICRDRGDTVMILDAAIFYAPLRATFGEHKRGRGASQPTKSFLDFYCETE